METKHSVGYTVDSTSLISWLDERLESVEVVLHSLSKLEEFCQELPKAREPDAQLVTAQLDTRGQGSEGMDPGLTRNRNLDLPGGILAFCLFVDGRHALAALLSY